MNTTGKRRLLKLADFLETVPPRQFDMGTWGDDDCGTAACALGWATTIPSFQRLGLRRGPAGEPRLGALFSYEAAGHLFDITRSAAFGLFSSGSAGQTPKQVARSIREFVASNPA